MTEQRQDTRHRSLLRGIVYFDGRPFAHECLVRDISEKGARIAFPDPPPAHADRLELQVPIKSLRHQCRVAWRGDAEVGVSFTDVAATEMSPQAMAERMARLEAELESLKQIVRALRGEMKADHAA
ncbi:MAG TPA: PilZ domain-containing protein [Gammaproteobacteria bacterium]|nr:PilZ domain-containing protein [Gammaproteobacteria bacterium]